MTTNVIGYVAAIGTTGDVVTGDNCDVVILELLQDDSYGNSVAGPWDLPVHIDADDKLEQAEKAVSDVLARHGWELAGDVWEISDDAMYIPVRAASTGVPEGLDEWLGPAWDQLTAGQIETLGMWWRAVDQRYPDPDDQAERDAALSAAVQYLLGETSLEDAGGRLQALRLAELEAKAAAKQLVAMAVPTDVSESEAARQLGVDRATVRAWMGK